MTALRDYLRHSRELVTARNGAAFFLNFIGTRPSTGSVEKAFRLVATGLGLVTRPGISAPRLLDLLFFHTEQLRYVVVELKTGKFKPEHSGQLGFYVALVDERLRRPQHAHTVGILLCSDKNDSVVRYALAGSQAPIAVSSYDLLPAAEKAALPSEDELTRAVKGSRDG